MKNNVKKQSSKQKKIMVASILLAGVIMAGGTFAWFTSSDEVTNRLTASANYGVSITEDFTPTDNWTPGQQVNKDVFGVNTGNIAAFVKVSLGNNFELTIEGATQSLEVNTAATTDTSDTEYVINGTKITAKRTTQYLAADLTDIDNLGLIKLSDTEKEAIEAGGRLAFPIYSYAYTVTDSAEINELVTSLGFDSDNKDEQTAIKTVGAYTYTYKYDVDGGENSTAKIDVSIASNSTIIDDDSDNVLTDWKPPVTGLYIFEGNKSNITGADEYSAYYAVVDDNGTVTYYAVDELDLTKDENTNKITTVKNVKLKTEATVNSGSNDQNFKVEFVKDNNNSYVTESESEKYLTAQVTYTDEKSESTPKATKTVKVKIYLVSDYADYWEIKEVTSGDDPDTYCEKLEFYYRDILEAGQTTHQLVDKIELDESAANSNYLNFIYDLKVTLDSAQVVINEDGQYTAEGPVNTNAAASTGKVWNKYVTGLAKGDGTPADIQYDVTWGDVAPTGNTPPAVDPIEKTNNNSNSVGN